MDKFNDRHITNMGHSYSKRSNSNPIHRRVVDIHLWKLGKFLIVLQGGFSVTACDLHSQGHNSK